MSPPAKRSPIGLFLALPGLERRLLFEAWWRLLSAALRLRLAPRRTLAQALLPGAAPAVGAAVGEAIPASAGDAALAVARAAGHHLWPMTCLPRSLALQRMLARRGIAASLAIGVRREGGDAGMIAAHAWVEVGGQAVGEPEAVEERFRPLLPPLAGASSARGEERRETDR